MRISSINVAQPRNVNYNLRTRQSLPQVSLKQEPDSVSFKGLRAGIFGMIGAGLGATIGTVISGGLLAPLLLASEGTYVGCVSGSDNKDATDQYGR